MKKWINWVILVIVFAIACGFLSHWQFERRAAKVAAIALVQNNYRQDPVSVERLLAGRQFKVPQDVWRSVTVSGHYLPDSFLLVRDRPNNGEPGFEELVPFATDNWGVIFVSRGWLPSGETRDYPDEVPLPTNAQVQLTAKIVQAEPKLNRGAPKGELASINISLAERETGLRTDFKNSYLRLQSETPMAGTPLVKMPAPSTDEGNNLSYAFQWIMFALMAGIALIWRIRRDRQLEAGIEPKQRKTRSSVDEAFEDSLTTEK